VAEAGSKIQHWQTPSGAKVYFVENHDLPMLMWRSLLRRAAALTTRKKSGLAGLTHGMLDLGAEGMSEDDIARAACRYWRADERQFDDDRSGIVLRTLSSATERNKALEVMARVLQRPLFPETVLVREKARLIAALKEAETRPESIASKAFTRMCLAPIPTVCRLRAKWPRWKKLQRSDLENFYFTHYAAKGAVVALMGDISRAEAELLRKPHREFASGRCQPPHCQGGDAEQLQRTAHSAPGNAKPHPDRCARRSAQ